MQNSCEFIFVVPKGGFVRTPRTPLPTPLITLRCTSKQQTVKPPRVNLTSSYARQSQYMHTAYYLDTTPGRVGEEVNRGVDVGDGGIAKEKLQFGGVDVTTHRQDLNGHLSGECELVALEQASRSVDEDRVRDAVDQVDDTLLQLFSCFRSVYGLLKHYAESL